MNEKSLLDYGFDVMSASKEAMSFFDLFNAAVAASGLTLQESEKKSKMAKFYTSLSLDGRFITLKDNCWDLRARHNFEQFHIDMGDVYSEDDDEDDQEEKSLLDKEAGVYDEDESYDDSDDLDYDKPVKDSDDDDQEF